MPRIEVAWQRALVSAPLGVWIEIALGELGFAETAVVFNIADLISIGASPAE